MPTTRWTASITCSGWTMVAASSSYAYAVGTSCELSRTTYTKGNTQLTITVSRLLRRLASPHHSNAVQRTLTWWSSSSKRDSLMMADREAPMPPVFMHSSTMMALRVFLMLLLMVSMSKGFKLIRSITWRPDNSLGYILNILHLCQDE